MARSSTVIELIEQAYGLKPWTIFGGPDWARVDRFTIRATTGANVTREQMTLMLQRLLAGRFHLQLAPETQTVPLYRLTAGTVRNLSVAAKPNEPAVINLKELDNASQQWEARNATMGRLAAALSQRLRTPVVDETKLTGAFDFRFDFAQDDVFGNKDSDWKDGRTIFAALEKRLGLKLVGAKALFRANVIRGVLKP